MYGRTDGSAQSQIAEEQQHAHSQQYQEDDLPSQEALILRALFGCGLSSGAAGAGTATGCAAAGSASCTASTSSALRGRGAAAGTTLGAGAATAICRSRTTTACLLCGLLLP